MHVENLLKSVFGNEKNESCFYQSSMLSKLQFTPNQNECPRDSEILDENLNVCIYGNKN